MDMKKKLVVVSHTHWDREWYLTFQHTRLKLVRLVDQLLGLLAVDPDYRHFMCDGQTIMLEDYVEVRPERREELIRRIEEGRLVIGPWYVLADEFIPGGEPLIRNLILGQRTMASFGAAPHGVGYLPDAFGHMAQMPQILRGFGLDSAVLWRGVPHEVDKSEFTWQGLDGSDVLAIHLPNGYSNAQTLPLREDALLARLALIRSQLESKATTEYLLLMNGNDHIEPQPELSRVIALANERLADAEVVHGTLPMFIAGVRASTNGNGDLRPKVRGELRSVNGAHLLQGVLSARMWVKQQNKMCETLLTRWAEPFTAVAGLVDGDGGRNDVNNEGGPARMPHASPQPLLWLAWKYLLQNHAHDSICGCSVDEVYEDVKARFNWSSQIGEELTRQALSSIAANVRLADLPAPSRHEVSPDEERSRLAFVVFNAESGPRTDLATIRTKAPADSPDVVLADDEGNPLPYQVLAQHHNELLSTDISRSDLEGFLLLVGGGNMTVWTKEKIDALEGLLAITVADKFPKLVITGVEVKPSLIPSTVIIEIGTAEEGDHNYQAIANSLSEVAMLVMHGDVEYFQLRISRRDEVEIGFVARDVPGYGYRTYQLLPGHRSRREAYSPTGSYTINNEHFFVQASPADGSLTVIDRETGAVYEHLNQFVDGGDAGDEYNYCPPTLEDRLITSPASPPVITLVETGPARSTLRIDTVLMLPRSLAAGRRQRSEEPVPCAISSFVSLHAGVRRIDIRTRVDNRAEDHRLRVHFPTRIIAGSSRADHSFAVIERPLAPFPIESAAEQALGTYPQHTFAEISDGEVGLLVASRGLPEYEAIKAENGTTIAITLLRSVGWLSRDDLTTRQGNAGPALPTPGAQCPGEHEFHYALVPYARDGQDAVRQAYWFVNPLRTMEAMSSAGELPLKLSFVEIEPHSLQVSAIKAAEAGDGIVVRFFNPGEKGQLAKIRANFPSKRIEAVNLGEQRIGDIAGSPAEGVTVPIAAGQILTLKFVT